MTGDLFSIEMFPAQQGDALWIEYGSRDRPNRVLIDGGTPPTIAALRERIMSLASDDRHFDLIAVTHIDTDHIGGMLKLASDPSLGVTTDDFWFNGWPQLPGTDKEERLGPIDGEILQLLIASAGFPWNQAFDGKAAVLPEALDAPLQNVLLSGGMSLTVLSPSSTELTALKTEWRSVLEEAGLDGPDFEAGLEKAMKRKGVVRPDLLGDARPDVDADASSTFTSDRAVANSTSIGLLAEFAGRSALLTGDAWAPVLEAGIRRLLARRHRETLPLDLLKMGHHGSKNNTSMSLLDTLTCSRFLFSSSGAIFSHPDHQAVSRAIASVKARGDAEATVYFNYRTEFNEVWAEPDLQVEHNYRAVYPDPATNGHLRIDV